MKPFVRDTSAYMFRTKRLLPVATISLVYIMDAPRCLGRGALCLPLGPLTVLLEEVYVASVLELEELGVLVGFKYIAFLGPIDQLLKSRSCSWRCSSSGQRLPLGRR